MSREHLVICDKCTKLWLRGRDEDSLEHVAFKISSLRGRIDAQVDLCHLCTDELRALLDGFMPKGWNR